jgi:outer membrane receptor protein involved in Fe transport
LATKLVVFRGAHKRNRKNLALDVKLVSDEDGKIFNNTTSWTFGGYYQNQKYTLDRFTKYAQTGYKESTTLATNYETKSLAVYGQLDTEINSKLTLVTGIRIEDWRASYKDNQLVVADFSPDTYTSVNIKYDKVLYGGKLGLNYQYDRDILLYTSLSRGYKPGGVNIDATLAPAQKTYETEILWNIEAGMNSTHLDNSLMSRLNFFYAKRKDQQIGSSIQNGANFTEYLANAASGYNYGIESELDYYPNESLHVYSRIGLLKTKFDEYNNPDPTSHNVTGRGQAQSPTYQYNVGFDVTFGDGWIFKTNIEGKGSYYFSDAHDKKSKPYTLAHSSLEYTNGSWSTVLWVRNITNKDYAVKGYYFDNKIADGNGDGNAWNEPELYTQKGAPRTFGVTVAYDF